MLTKFNDEDFSYTGEAELDRDAARESGYHNQDRAWILTGRDAWYPNPYYTGLPVPHPEDDYAMDAFIADPDAWRKAERERRAVRSALEVDDCPF